MNIRLFLFLPVLVSATYAGPRTSANYSITTETAEAGGKRTTSANYTNDGSAGGVTGLSTVAAPAETVKHGFAAQLYDVTGLTLTAASNNVNETATLPLSAWQALDDATFLATAATSVNWGVVSGPITGISTSGVATAGLVYQNTAASVQGAFGGFTGSLNLTVVDFIPDNFGSYAGDGIGDDWQVQYFGQPPNANAAPNVDYDHTGQTNLFKYIAGLNPLDSNSRFVLKIAAVPDPLHPGQFLSGQKNLIFSPLVAGRTYTVSSRPSMTIGSYVPLTNPSAPSDAGQQRTITDFSASGPAKFYRVEITKP